jgi:hypothetical protein
MRKLSALALACGALIAMNTARAAAMDSVMGGGLRQLVHESEASDPRLPAHVQMHLHNAAGEPLVRVHLRDGADARKLGTKLAAAGLKVTAISKLDPSHLEGYLSLRDARAIAGLDVVRSVSLVHKPARFAGSVQSQAVPLEKADIAQGKGYDGSGIKVGALSDSFDTCSTCITHAADDVASGDLPAGGVTVLEDLGGGADEGRAMLQLVHDLAPGSQLGFATAFNGEVDFSNNILALRSSFGADVITDDVIYFDEPMYSDGLLAQTVDQVVSDGAAYYSSAGNNGVEAYEATYQPMSWSQALQLADSGQTPLKLDQIPADLVPKSVHIFSGGTSKGAATSISQRITVAADAIIDFQWDEPFFLDKVKTDYNIYVFDNKGNWIPPNGTDEFPIFYSTDDNIATDQAMEIAELLPNGLVVKGNAVQNDYYIMIGKMNNGSAPHIKYVAVNTLAVSQFEGAPSTWGHAAASNGQGVAATYYAIPSFPEDFSAAGPVTIYFDNAGNKLKHPVTRNVPQITAADGVDNTFFGFDPDLDGFPNFFGTSAAAPDAAGVAALVLQAAGGPGSIPPAAVYAALQSTAHQIPVANVRNKAHANAGPVKLELHGDWTRWGNYWELLLDKSASGAVASVVIDTSGTTGPLVFNPITTRFYLGASKGVTMSDITYSVSTDQKQATLAFVTGSFAPGEHFHFGTSVFNPIQGSTQEDADRLRGATITVTMEDGTTYSGTVEAQQTTGINRYTGAGLIDAMAAIRAVKN